MLRPNFSLSCQLSYIFRTTRDVYPKPSMCSVDRCESWRRNEQRFKLPKDPEKRLEWVQFLAEVNSQRFKESSWTDITICKEHFTTDSFETSTLAGSVQLKTGAVPSLTVDPEPDCPEIVLELTDTTDISSQLDLPKTCATSASDSEECSSMIGVNGSPTLTDVSHSTDTSDAFSCYYVQMLKNIANIDLIREKAALLEMKKKHVVNEKQLLQLFSSKCPSCDGKLKTEKVVHRVLLILNQRCLHCKYKYQWKSQVKAQVPVSEDQHLTGGRNGTTEGQQAESTDISELVAVVGEQSYPHADTGSSRGGAMEADEEWNPSDDVLTESDENVNEDDDDALVATKPGQLCTDCGMFFNKWKHHMCEHKVKPYSCNICGKRFANEISIKSHGRVHEDCYDHLCKYCHVNFKSKVEKVCHEQTHLIQRKPYKCANCSQTFASYKERRIHLINHRNSQDLKCRICGMEFNRYRSLKRHLVLHTGVKPYKCSVCQRGFNQSGHLKSHLRLHTGERPYKCHHCEQRFNHNVSLKSHVLRYHPPTCEQSMSKTDRAAQESDTVEQRMRNQSNTEKNKREIAVRPIGRPKRDTEGNLV